MNHEQLLAIADVLRKTRPQEPNDAFSMRREEISRLNQWLADVGAIAKFCALQTPTFNRLEWFDYVTQGKPPIKRTS